MNKQFLAILKHPLRFRLFLLSKLPSAYFSGVRVKEMDEKRCVVTIPYKWFSRNPFRSTYFACLAMAAEMSTGALAMGYLYKKKPAVSMLVLKVEGEYYKKAVGRTQFVCEMGDDFRKGIEETIATGEAKTIDAKSNGYDADGNLIASFTIRWSFKARVYLP